MISHIGTYLKFYKGVWTKRTWYAESSRLKVLSEDLALGAAACQSKWASHYAPYTLKQHMLRIAHYVDWLIESGHYQGPNEWRQCVRRSAALFKRAYQPKRVEISFSEAKQRLQKLAEPERLVAERMLFSGLRFSEAFAVQGDEVKGKGQRTRRVFGVVTGPVRTTPSRVRRALAKVNLKPHDLRKLFATQCAERGASAQDLCRLAGWKNIQTAYWYLQPGADAKLEQFVKEFKHD